MEEASELFVKGQRGRLKSRRPKRDSEASSSFACCYCRKPHIKKNLMKYKEMLKRKGDKDSDGASTSGKSDQAGVFEEEDEDSCDVLTAKYSDAWFLDSGCTYYMCPKKEWFSTYKPYDRSLILHIHCHILILII